MSSERITKKDVGNAFQRTVLAAGRAGLRGTESWVLYNGNATAGVSYYIRSERFTLNLSTSAKTAYEKLTAMTVAFNEISAQRADDNYRQEH